MSNIIVPELAVTDWRTSRDFYCRLLGFRCLYERPEEGFSYLVRDGAELMIDQIGLGRTFGDGFQAETRPFGRGVNLQIRVASLRPLLDALQTAQVALYLPPEDRWYRKNDGEVGHRQFVVPDPDGYLLRFHEELGRRPLRMQPQ